MTAAAPKPLTAADLEAALCSRYESPEWHVESEVTLAGRRLDLVAFNLWGARSYRVVGFEIKVSRGDLLRELADFRKSEEWLAVVDQFFLVTPPKLVRADELPEGWGLLELCGSRLMTRRPAAIKEPGRTLPREVAARFFARLAQRESIEARTAESRARESLRAEIRKEVEERHAKDTANIREERARLEQEIAELYEAMGIRRHEWDAHRRAIAAANVFARFERDAKQIANILRRSLNDVNGHAKTIADALASVEGASA